MTGTFHDPHTLWLADFLQRNGTIECDTSTGRWLLTIDADGRLDITSTSTSYKGKAGVSAMALGQRLVPLHRDGFSTSFMTRVTDRMAIGLTANHVYLVAATTDIWRLASFMQDKLHVDIAINSDGGHVVRGRAPVHLVFRWRRPSIAALPSPSAGVHASLATDPDRLRRPMVEYTAAESMRGGR